MTGKERVVLIILAVNILVVLIYVIAGYLRKKEKKFSIAMKAMVMLLCPVVGAVFLALGELFFRLFFAQAMDLDDVIFSKDRVKTYLHPDEERERNLVSVEEALAITDKENLRELMLNVVRGDVRNSLASLSMALNSEDSETAHYAASVLQDILNDFRANVQKRYQEILQGSDNRVLLAAELIDYMNQVLEQKVFTRLEQKSMTDLMEQVCEILYKEDKEKMMSSHYEAVSMRLLDVRDYEKCRKWCERAAVQYPGVLSSYTCRLKLYFSCEYRENFFQVLDELKKSNIVIDNETLEMIRVFL